MQKLLIYSARKKYCTNKYILVQNFVKRKLWTQKYKLIILTHEKSKKKIMEKYYDKVDTIKYNNSLNEKTVDIYGTVIFIFQGIVSNRNKKIEAYN